MKKREIIPDNICNFILIGSKESGKTSICKRITQNMFIHKYELSQNTSTYEYIFQIDNKYIKFNLIDVVNIIDIQEILHNPPNNTIILIIFDLFSLASFEEAGKYFFRCLYNTKDIPIFLCGNKCDNIDINNINHCMYNETIYKFINKSNIEYYMISAKDGTYYKEDKNSYKISNGSLEDLFIDLYCDHYYFDKNNVENTIENVTEKYDTLSKVILLGNLEVGKSCLCKYIKDNKFTDEYLLTMGVDFIVFNLINDNKIIKVQLWDICGNDRFKAVASCYIKESKIIILLFDLSSYDSFRHVDSWRTLALECSNGIMIVVGNKCDLNDKIIIQQSEIDEYCQKYNLKYFKISIKNGFGIEELLNFIKNNL